MTPTSPTLRCALCPAVFADVEEGRRHLDEVHHDIAHDSGRDRVAQFLLPLRQRSEVAARNRRVNLTLAGTLCLAVGFYFLVLAPGTSSGLGGTVVNLQRMTLGETLSLMGAIFLAAAWRPLQ